MPRRGARVGGAGGTGYEQYAAPTIPAGQGTSTRRTRSTTHELLHGPRTGDGGKVVAADRELRARAHRRTLRGRGRQYSGGREARQEQPRVRPPSPLAAFAADTGHSASAPTQADDGRPEGRGGVQGASGGRRSGVNGRGHRGMRREQPQARRARAPAGDVRVHGAGLRAQGQVRKHAARAHAAAQHARMHIARSPARRVRVNGARAHAGRVRTKIAHALAGRARMQGACARTAKAGRHGARARRACVRMQSAYARLAMHVRLLSRARAHGWRACAHRVRAHGCRMRACRVRAHRRRACACR
eukprot:6176730-Pleurochrysis_carterae.AAC.2